MTQNTKLRAAKRAKNDEFYTRREDVEAELQHYADHFRGKTVYCNCDDERSAFWQYFKDNFHTLGLQRLIATHKEPVGSSYGMIYFGVEVHRFPLKGSGDFRDEDCLEILKKADIVVTNPPFSLFREFVFQMMESQKSFVVIGSKSAINYLCPLIKENKIWVGMKNMNGSLWFRTPAGCGNRLTREIDGELLTPVPCSWFTNLDIPKRHQPINLAGNHYSPEMYPRYDNYDAIDVSRVSGIPEDYDGVMGVPITFMNQYCPSQFEILGITYSTDKSPEVEALRTDPDHRHVGMINGKLLYPRILIRKKEHTSDDAGLRDGI